MQDFLLQLGLQFLPHELSGAILSAYYRCSFSLGSMQQVTILANFQMACLTGYYLKLTDLLDDAPPPIMLLDNDMPKNQQ